MAVVDLLEAVEIEKQDRERPAVALRPHDLGVEHLDQLPVIGEPGEGIADGEVAQPRFDPPALGHDGGEGQRGDGDDRHERLQQQQRFVRRASAEREPAPGAVAAGCGPLAPPGAADLPAPGKNFSV